jgi:hypothetical protein
MRTKRIAATNKTAVYLIVFVVISAAFLLLGGGPWLKGLIHGSNSTDMIHLNWPQVLISFGLGFLLCLVVSRRK